MNTFKTLCLLASVLTFACANPSGKLKPSNWLSSSQLQSLPNINDLTLQRLESMPVEEGAQLVERLHHLAKINHQLEPSFIPSPTNIPVYISNGDGEKTLVNLNTLVSTLKQRPNFGNDEVTIFITGLPYEQSETVKKANHELITAYKARYNRPEQQMQLNANANNKDQTSSEEHEKDLWKSSRPTTGNLIIIDLGSTLTKFSRIALLNVEKTGDMIGNVMVQFTNELDVPHEIIHVVAQGIAAHVAGAAGRTYQRLTSNQLRRITALDPSKIISSLSNTVIGLARGDAEFVDAIHTSSYGMGTRQRVGDVDFYPNGPSVAMPGTKNVVETSMRATRYYAESVLRGNERNFPAVAGTSLKQYQSQRGNGPRAYMGCDTAFDIKGDYVLEVNAQKPYGRRAVATKQTPYHGSHTWNQKDNTDY